MRQHSRGSGKKKRAEEMSGARLTGSSNEKRATAEERGLGCLSQPQSSSRGEHAGDADDRGRRCGSSCRVPALPATREKPVCSRKRRFQQARSKRRKAARTHFCLKARCGETRQRATAASPRRHTPIGGVSRLVFECIATRATSGPSQRSSADPHREKSLTAESPSLPNLFATPTQPATCSVGIRKRAGTELRDRCRHGSHLSPCHPRARPPKEHGRNSRGLRKRLVYGHPGAQPVSIQSQRCHANEFILAIMEQQ